MNAKEAVIWLVVCVAFTAGCASKGYTTFAVSGTVKHADGSIPAGEVTQVSFIPVAQTKGAQSAFGEIQKDGRFQISTYEANDGALAGEYKVTFTIFKSYAGQEQLVAEKFTKSETTPFTVKVGPGEKAEQYNFVIEKAP